MPTHKVKISTPEIALTESPDRNIWCYVDDNFSHVEQRFQDSIKHLSNALARLREIADSKLLPPERRDIKERGNGHNSRRREYNEVLICFAPEEVDDFYAAILQGDIEGLTQLQANVDRLEIKDKSFVLRNTFSVNKEVIYSEHPRRELITHFNGHCTEYNVPDKYVSETLCSNEVNAWDSGKTFHFSPVVLATLCKQPQILRMLLAKSSPNECLDPCVDNFNLFELAWIAAPDMLDILLEANPQAVLEAFCRLWDQKPDIYQFSYRGYYSWVDMLPMSPCTLNTIQIHSLLEYTLKTHTNDDYIYEPPYEWFFSSPQFDSNLKINSNNETIIFELLRARAFKFCAHLLKTKPDMDLRLENSSGQKCFDIISCQELCELEGLYEREEFWASLISNQYAKEACNFLKDGSQILHTLLLDPKNIQAAEYVYEANPNLMLVKDAKGRTPLARIKNPEWGNHAALFQKVKAHHPALYVEHAIKNKCHFFGFFSQNNDPNIAAAKNYIEMHFLEEMLMECSPDIYARIFPVERVIECNPTILPPIFPLVAYEGQKTVAAIEVPVNRPITMPALESRPASVPVPSKKKGWCTIS